MNFDRYLLTKLLWIFIVIAILATIAFQSDIAVDTAPTVICVLAVVILIVIWGVSKKSNWMLLLLSIIFTGMLVGFNAANVDILKTEVLQLTLVYLTLLTGSLMVWHTTFKPSEASQSLLRESQVQRPIRR